MSDPAAALTAIAEKVVPIAFGDGLTAAESAMPGAVALIVKAVLATPLAQAVEVAVEHKLIDLVSEGAQKVEAEFHKLALAEAQKHPVLSKYVAAVAGSPAAAAVVSEAEKFFGPKLGAALEKLKSQGKLGFIIGDLETALMREGVL